MTRKRNTPAKIQFKFSPQIHAGVHCGSNKEKSMP